MDDADGDLHSGGNGADGFAALAAAEDRGAFVVVDNGAAAAAPAACAGGVQTVLKDDPEDVPAAVVDYVAEQLGLQAADLKGYGEKEARWDHQEQIRTGYGYTAFEGEQWFALACWL
ncbi:DUF4158 domain-containing protein [Nonomuraea sp. H19]|uniref:DUF4158 domain-containing protein n=1 Tax=Nonomuraea sp. H19 TaxID=3452206 RepID=UPI003F8B5214